MKRYAMIVGQQGPTLDKIKPLTFVKNDVKFISEVLSQKPSDYKVSDFSDTIRPDELIANFEEIASQCKVNDSLLFYFSGHGRLHRGALYLLCNKSDLSRLISTSIPISLIKSIFANSMAKVKIMILDCCHSGAVTQSMFHNKGHEIQIHEPLYEASQESSSAILAACGSFATTRELPEFQSGYLTYRLVQALGKQFTEADMDGDGLLSTADFIDWCGQKTLEFNLSRDIDQRIEAPRLFQEVSSKVFLTAHRVSLDSELNEKLRIDVNSAVDKITEAFENGKMNDNKVRTRLARPIKNVAPTFTDLGILNELFKKGDSASIFAAATILHERRDPRYMEQLITYINDKRLRVESVWRVLWAIFETKGAYEFSGAGKEDITRRLKDAAERWQNVPFDKWMITSMIRDVCDRCKIPYEEVFSKRQLAAINKIIK